MAGVPAGTSVVMTVIGLAGVIGVLAACLAEHAPAAQVAEHVRAQQVAAPSLRVAADTRAGAGALPVPADRGHRLEQVAGDQGLMPGLR